ncbi:unnamed protein product [Notodromas monacha]|uniref:Dopey N-terminal domain-containing protein n=1 Tax=Notodromas monacha TaxID=399045 RepID=A0A7R9BH74_9CRUS|nr:unnamed protein product [Notodromas monacha]CAG0914057.1 unnamed protein product [Notodromas monacha]
MSFVSLEESELYVDPKYRSYVAAIDKALKNFEYSAEWPDLISALGKLNKASPVNGVHLKALETYDILFKCIGRERLSQELFIYSSGLFPLFGIAAMTVRPFLLSLYETHLLPLGADLQPALPGILTGVLPSLDETSDYYQRTVTLLDNICGRVNPCSFYGSVWKCAFENNSVRLAAVNLILSRFNRKLSMEDQLHLLGPDLDLVVAALSTCFQEGGVLVQRAALDLLVAGFPLREPPLGRSDMITVATAAVSVVLRRDVSLNRSSDRMDQRRSPKRYEQGDFSQRLTTLEISYVVQNWDNRLPKSTVLDKISSFFSSSGKFGIFWSRRLLSWLLGSEVQSSSSVPSLLPAGVSPYFQVCGKSVIVAALVRWLSKKGTSLEPYRIVAALLERLEIGTFVVDDLFIDILRSLYHNYSRDGNSSCEQRNSDQEPWTGISSESMKVVNLVFGVLEADYVWNRCQLVCCSAIESRKEDRDEQDDRKLVRTASCCSTIVEEVVQEVGSKTVRVPEISRLVSFLLEVVGFQAGFSSTANNGFADTDTGTTVSAQDHLRLMLESILKSLALNHNHLNHNETVHSLRLCESILTQIQPLSGTRKASSKGGNRRDGLDAAVGHFLDFFVAFMGVRIFDGVTEIERLWKVFQADSGYGALNSTRKFAVDVLSTTKPSIKLSELSLWGPSFHVCCRLLVQFSSFPTYFTLESRGGSPGQGTSLPNQKLELQVLIKPFVNFAIFFPEYFVDQNLGKKCSENEETQDLADWVRVLACAAVHLQTADFPMHAAAIRTLTELTSLLLTSMESNKTSMSICKPPTPVMEEMTPVSVVIKPLLLENDLKTLLVDTRVTELLAHVLWRHVDCAGSPETVDSVALLHKLHATLPLRAARLLENCLCETLADSDARERAVAAQRFAVFWHYTRELQKRTPSASLRNLDRCVLLMLENLSSDTPAALKSCAEGWLVHSLHRGDVARLFDPIFLILLDPGCARIGVQKYFDELRMKEKTSRTDMDVEMTEMADLKEVDEVEEELGVEVDSDEDESEAKRRDMLKKSCSMPDLDKFSSGNVDEDDDASLIIATIVDELIRKVVDAESGTENTEAKSSVFKPGHRRQRSQSFSMIESVRSPSPASLFSENPSQSVLSLGERLHSLRPNDEPVAEDPLHSFLLVYDCVPDLAQVRFFRDHELFKRVFTLRMTVCLASCVKVKYALTLMQAAVMTHPNSVLRGLVSTNLSSAHSPRANELQKLLARHKRSMRGLAFAGKLSGQEASSVQRGITLFEILVFSCLSFIRSCLAVGNDGCDVIWNSEVRLAAVDLLTVTFLETLDLVRANGRGFASFIVDMLLRCKVQKIVLRSLASSVDRVKKRLDSEEEQEEDCGTKWQIRASEMLLEFNEGGVDVDCGSGGTGRSFPEALQIHLLRLLHALLMLEHEVGVVQTVNPSSKVMDTEKWAKITFVAPTSSLRYMIGQPIPAQSIFLHSMLTVLRQEKLRHLHGAWLATVTASLPFLGRTLSQTALLLARQICFNLESIQNVVQEKEEERLSRGRRIPPDYVVRSLEALSSLCHFCLLDNAECSVLSGITGSHFQATASSLTNPTSSISRIGGGGSKPSSSHTTQIINNLINVFIPSVPLKVPESSRESRAAKDALESARKALLGVLPRIVVAMASLWSSACDLSCRDEYSWVLGHPRDVKHHVLEFISPIAVTHGTNFLVAAAVAWHDSKKRMKLAIPSESKNEAAKVGEEREKLVALITAIKSLPPDRVIHLVTQIVSSIPSSHSASTLIGIHSDWNRAVHFSSNSLGPVNSQAVENSVLELFVAYVERCPQQQLVESFPAVASLVKEALAVAALSQSSNSTLAFVTHECVAQVFNVLYAFVQRVPSSLEKRDQRELQDLSVRVLDLLGQSAGLCLEQTAWLRPRTVVKQDLQLIPNSSDYATDISKNATEEPPPEKVDIVDCPEYKPNKPEDTRVPVIGLKKGSERAIAEQCLCSLRLLADKVASFLDVTYASDEKERVVPILSSLLTNVTPYLRNHAKGNMLRHRACAQMLSAISSFPYARKAWKRDALDLFLDPAFFRMDLESLRHWKSLLDNLVAQEKLLFKDLLIQHLVLFGYVFIEKIFLDRFPVGPSGSLNLFSSREAEAELRSLLLKRIAFLLFCSDSDQYQQFVPVLQEKLGECLRWSTVTSSGSAQTGPAVQAGVFLCFRVLLLRSSAPHLSALWPSIITELVQVLLQIEQDLSSDSEEFKQVLFY